MLLNVVMGAGETEEIRSEYPILILHVQELRSPGLHKQNGNDHSLSCFLIAHTECLGLELRHPGLMF